MAQVFNFKRMEVTGSTKEEALAKAPFSVMGDATQAYKLWAKKQVNGITDADKKQFMLDYLAKKSKNVEGVGFAITITPAVADKRVRPYTIKNFKNESGTRKYHHVFQLIDKATNNVIAEVPATMAKAKEIGKELYINKGYKGNLKVRHIHVTDSEPIAFEMTYTPSQNTQVGTYVVFGIEKA